MNEIIIRLILSGSLLSLPLLGWGQRQRTSTWESGLLENNVKVGV